jgi:hypothetical protein
MLGEIKDINLKITSSWGVTPCSLINMKGGL